MGILSGRVAILVGASSGVGYGCALDFAREGATVVAAARRLEKLEELAKDAAGRGFEGKIHPITCDVAKESDLDKIVKFTADTFGRIEILACIAQGGLNHQTYLLEATEEEALDFYRTGPIYTMKLIQKCHPYMKKQNYGRVIVTSSNSGLYGNFGQANYRSVLILQSVCLIAFLGITAATGALSHMKSASARNFRVLIFPCSSTYLIPQKSPKMLTYSF